MALEQMRAKVIVASVLVALLFAWTVDHGAQPSVTALPEDPWPTVSDEEMVTTDIVQHTCALDVILKTFALDGAGAPIHCAEPSLDQFVPEPEAPMLACKQAPAASVEPTMVEPQNWP